MATAFSKNTLYQQLADIEELASNLSSPWGAVVGSLTRQSKMVDLGAYSEALRSFSSLSEMYRLPDYFTLSSFVRQDAVDSIVEEEPSPLTSSTRDDISMASPANTRADDINRANQEYLEYLRTRTDDIANAISRTEFEDGMDNDITLLIRSFAKENKSATYNWLDELYSKNINKPSVVQGVLRSLAMITERGDENILLPIVVAGLRSNNSCEQEAAIMVIEEWRTKECLEAIGSVTSFSSEMIADYAKMVINELREELG